MAFAPVLNGFCDAIGCSNKELAEACGISMSSLSRYRNSKRIPRSSADAIDKLADGLVMLAEGRGMSDFPTRDKVRETLYDSLHDAQPLGPSFSARVDSLMKVLDLRNSDIAASMHLDSSYISRIRRGERTPNDKIRFAEMLSRHAAIACMEEGRLSAVMALIDPSGASAARWESLTIDTVAPVADVICRWLLGDQIMESDVAAFDYLLSRLDEGYSEEVLAETTETVLQSSCPTETEPSARFCQGDDFAFEAEMQFLEGAAACGAQNLYLSSDLPGLETEFTPERLAIYQKRILELIRRGCKITVIHSTFRPLREYLAAMLIWIPLYMTGSVAPLYVEQASSGLFCHANNVCECCAMASEAVRGHERDGRYYLTSLPEDIAYYRKKMDFILEKAHRQLEIYHCDNDEEMRAFSQAKAEWAARCSSREVRKGVYKNLRIVLYEGECAIVYSSSGAGFVFVIRQPKLRYVLSHMS